MTPLDREVEIVKLQDHRARLGMMNVAQLDYSERVLAMAQYRLDIRAIDEQILALRNEGAAPR